MGRAGCEERLIRDLQRFLVNLQDYLLNLQDFCVKSHDFYQIRMIPLNGIGAKRMSF